MVVPNISGDKPTILWSPTTLTVVPIWQVKIRTFVWDEKETLVAFAGVQLQRSPMEISSSRQGILELLVQQSLRKDVVITEVKMLTLQLVMTVLKFLLHPKQVERHWLWKAIMDFVEANWEPLAMRLLLLFVVSNYWTVNMYLQLIHTANTYCI